MNEQIYIVSKDKFYNLTNLIQEFMEVEEKTEDEAIQYFMTGLKGIKYIKLPKNTPTHWLVKWIIED